MTVDNKKRKKKTMNETKMIALVCLLLAMAVRMMLKTASR